MRRMLVSAAAETKCDASGLALFAHACGAAFGNHPVGQRGRPILARPPPPISSEQASAEEAADHVARHVTLVLDRVNKELVDGERVVSELAAGVQADMRALAKQVGEMRELATSSRVKLCSALSGGAEERLMAIHDALLEIHDSMAATKADKSAVTRLEGAVSHLMQERGRLCSTRHARAVPLHDRVAVLATPSGHTPAEARLSVSRSASNFAPAPPPASGPHNLQAIAAHKFMDSWTHADGHVILP
ncbi:MAG: hypothetical protein SGPRY_008020 [Prymnesium sp.]